MSDNKEPFNIKNIQDSFNEQQAKILALREVVRKTESENKVNTTNAQEKIRNIAQCLTNIKSKAKQRQSLDRLDRSVSSEVISISEEDDRPFRIQQPNSRKSETKEKFQLLREQLEKNKLKIAERETNKKEIEEMVVKLKAEISNTQESLNRSSELGRSMSDLSTFHATPVGSKHKSSSDLSNAPQFNIDKERIKFLENRIRHLEKENQKLKTKSTIFNENSESSEEIKRLQSKIIDLNENINEKECIIEARTKAITLMTENLSAKGKNTVDMLEDTKTEMFQMQKKFLETEDTYRSEISRLNADFDILNNKITNLNEANNILETSRFELTMKISKLENDIQKEVIKNEELNVVIKQLELKISGYEIDENDGDRQEKDFKKNIGQEYAEKLQSLEDKIQEIQLENIQLKEAATNTNFTEIIADDQNSLEKIKFLENLINEQNEKIQEYSKTLEEQEQSILEKTTENKVLEANMLVLEEKLKSKAPKPLFADPERAEDDGEVNRLKQQLDESNKIMIKMKIKTKQLQKEIEKFKKTSNINAELVELTEKNQELSQKIVELEDEKGQLLLKLINNDEGKSDDSEKNRIESNSKELTKFEEEVELLNNKNVQLQNDKDDLQSKINHYIAENIDLLDKIEKFNKSSSSAESIEIVERLTQCEKREIEKYNLRDNQNIKVSVKTDASMGQELSDSLIKLREESAELMHKVELFTLERKEVLEKMEILSNENQDNLNKIEILNGEKKCLENKIEEMEKEKMEIANTSKILPVNVVDLLEKSEKSLQKMKTEIENYKKANDKNAKFNCSKKLAKEALNTYKQVEECLKTIKEITKIENNENIIPKESVLQIDTSEFLTQIENLQKDLINLQNENESKDFEISKLKTEIETFVNAMSQLNPKEENVDHTECLNQIKDLQNNLSTLENENSFKDLEINSLKSKIESLVISTNSTQNTQRDELDSTEFLKQIDNLEKELHIAQNENSSKDKIINNLSSKITSLEQEIIIFKDLIAEQKDQLISTINEHENEMELKSNELNEYKIELESYKINNVSLIEIEKLHDFNKTIQLELENKQITINALNDQIMELYRSMEEKSNELYAKDDEIALIEEKLIKAQNEFEILKKENFENKQVNEKLLTELHSQKEHLPIQIEYDSLSKENQNLKETIAIVEKSNKELCSRNSEQMDKLKKFAANLKKKQSQYQQLEDKIKILENNSSISDSNERIQNLEIELSNRIQCLKNERDNLAQELSVKSNELNSFKDDYKECLIIIKQINLDLLNYKQLLPNIYNILKSKHEEIVDLSNKIKTAKNTNLAMIEENKMLLQKMEKCKSIIKDKNNEIKRLGNEIKSFQENENQSNIDCRKYNALQNDYISLKDLHEKLLINYNDEKNSFQDTVSKLEISHNGIQAKLQENSAYIEILETENNSYKDKIYKLENCVSTFEERRLSLEKRTNILNDELQNKTTEFEKNEDALIYRLNMLSDHDDVIGSRLLAIEEQNEELVRKLEDLKQDHSDLTAKYSKVEKEHVKLKSENEDKEKTINDEITQIKTKYENQKQEYEEKILKMQKDFEELENDYCIQLEKIQDEKQSLTISKEKLIDEINYYKDENVKLKETVNSLEQSKNDFERDITWIRMQNENLSQDQFELEELRLNSAQLKNQINELTQQVETITDNSEFEINKLKLEMNKLNLNTAINTNRTDDQVLVESENKKLKELLTEKDNAIEMYQRQNIQLQMCNFSKPPNTGDIFPNEIETLRERCIQYENTVTQLKQMCDNKDKHVEILQSELIQLNSLKSTNQANSAILDSTSSAWDNINIIDTDELIMPEIQKNKLQTGVFTTSIDTDYEKMQIALLQEKVLELEKYIKELENKLKIFSVQQPRETPQQTALSNFFSMDMPSTFDEFSNIQSEVNEVPIVPKTAYLCYEDNPDSNKVQPTPYTQSFQTTDAQKMEDLINELKNKIKLSEEEKQALQIKSGKIMKKLKEYKSKNDQLEQRSRKSSSIELNDLDLAIQDEMKLQLKQAEQKISEQQIKLDREILEKEKLLKRIDVLSDANDRMIEIKEKKDIEHQILQNNITELNKKIRALEDWSDEKPEHIRNESNTVLNVMPDTNEMENLRLKIEDLQLDRDEIQQLLDEEYMKSKNLESEITTLRNKIVILKNNDEQSSDNLAQQSNILKLQIANLNDTNAKLLNDLNILREENIKITTENLKLTSEYQMVEKQNTECLQCITFKEQLDDLYKKCFDNNALLEYREMEISELKQEIDKLEKEDQTSSLVQEILLKNQDILSLKNQVFELTQQNTDLENNLSLQITKELNQNTENLQNEYQEEISEKTLLIENLLKEKENMELELNELNDFILKDPNHSKTLGKTDNENPFADEINYYKNMCNQLAAELGELKKTFAESIEKTTIQENSIDNDFILWKQKCEQLAIELAYLKENENNVINIERTEKKVDDISDDISIENMQKVLEKQELEIVTLKEQLAVRSAEFAKLAAQYDPYALQSSSSAFLSQKISTKNDEVKQSELNLYLYLIHQKDMRCEELTLELVNLLEERDTLQLKLSDSIRKMEEIKLKTGYKDEENKSNTSIKQASSSSSDNSPEKKPLNEKISQLHSIGYMKDKSLYENRGNQIETFQKDIANIPLEAVSQIVGQDLAKSSQSPSAALLSWLWGKPNTNPDNT